MQNTRPKPPHTLPRDCHTVNHSDALQRSDFNLTFDSLGSGESKLETAVSYILIVGVVVSILLEIIGISLFYQKYGNVQIF